jgi:hypothetical protein
MSRPTRLRFLILVCSEANIGQLLGQQPSIQGHSGRLPFMLLSFCTNQDKPFPPHFGRPVTVKNYGENVSQFSHKVSLRSRHRPPYAPGPGHEHSIASCRTDKDNPWTPFAACESDLSGESDRSNLKPQCTDSISLSLQSMSANCERFHCRYRFSQNAWGVTPPFSCNSRARWRFTF